MTLLHGFLGSPRDWDGILPGNHYAVDWLTITNDVPERKGQCFLPDLAQLVNDSTLTGHDGTLVGYSMGGRIALHMLLDDEENQWKRAVIVSASPGIPDSDEKERRRVADEAWAERFRTADWAEVLAEWNALPVFEGDPAENLQREEAKARRGEWATALVRASVGWQASLAGPLSRLEIPILWVSGERDAKYAKVGAVMASLSRQIRSVTIPDAGHRVPWTNSKGFRDVVEEFLRETTQ